MRETGLGGEQRLASTSPPLTLAPGGYLPMATGAQALSPDMLVGEGQILVRKRGLVGAGPRSQVPGEVHSPFSNSTVVQSHREAHCPWPPYLTARLRTKSRLRYCVQQILGVWLPTFGRRADTPREAAQISTYLGFSRARTGRCDTGGKTRDWSNDKLECAMQIFRWGRRATLRKKTETGSGRLRSQD